MARSSSDRPGESQSRAVRLLCSVDPPSLAVVAACVARYIKHHEGRDLRVGRYCPLGRLQVLTERWMNRTLEEGSLGRMWPCCLRRSHARPFPFLSSHVIPFRWPRSRLTYEQFSSFLANIKELNAHRQTREVNGVGVRHERMVSSSLRSGLLCEECDGCLW